MSDIEDEEPVLIQGDTWIEELECALLAECDSATLEKIRDGKPIPASLRADYWKAILGLNDVGRVALNSEYDLENQLEIREDCEKLVEEISSNSVDQTLSDTDKLRLKSDFESTLTTYVKARPELSYIKDNGWIDILKVLHKLNLNSTDLYRMFYRIVDRYIPRDLSTKPPKLPEVQPNAASQSAENRANAIIQETRNLSGNASPPSPRPPEEVHASRPAQAYHLLRLLIQYHDPELCSILDSRKVVPSLYVKDWFCSLFARSCPQGLALTIWDTHFRLADPFLIFFAAIVMVVNASDELKKPNISQTDMLNVLKTMPGSLEEGDIEDLYYLVSNHYTNHTPRSIRSYSHLFFLDTFGNTYLGNDSPEEGQHIVDLKTTQLTNSLDLSQYLCLPIVPAEVLAIDTALLRSSPTHTNSLRYFLVDCRPAEQYNAGHLNRAFHLDCSLMLREPSTFATAVKALLDVQQQVVASKSNTGGQHLCFIGSGHEEEDCYVNMVVASFLKTNQKFVSIVVGGFDAIHDYLSTKSELKDWFNKYIIDHNPEHCKTCYTRTPETLQNFKNRKVNQANRASTASGQSSQSLFSSGFWRGGDKSAQTAQATAAALAQSGASMFDKFTNVFVSKSNVIKDRLVETLGSTTLPNAGTNAGASPSIRGHVSSQDARSKRYTGSSSKFAIDENDDDLNREDEALNEFPELQIENWLSTTPTIAFHKCAQVKGKIKYPGYIALTKTHLWIFREIPHNKGFARLAAKRPLVSIVQITSKRRHPDHITFRYGNPDFMHRRASKDDTKKKDVGEEELHKEPEAITEEPKSVMSVVEPQAKVEELTESTSNLPAQNVDDEPKKPEENSTKISQPKYVASDNLHIPQAFELIRLVKREVVREFDQMINNAELSKSQEQEDSVKSAQQTSSQSPSIESNTPAD